MLQEQLDIHLQKLHLELYLVPYKKINPKHIID